MRDEGKLLVTYGHDGPWDLNDATDEDRFTMEAWGAQMELRAIQRRNRSATVKTRAARRPKGNPRTFVAACRAATEALFTEVSQITEPSDDPRGMLNVAMRTYCRLLAANPGPGAGSRFGRLPGDPQGTGRVPHGVGPADGGAGGRHRHRGGPGPVLDEWRAGRHRLPSTGPAAPARG